MYITKINTQMSAFNANGNNNNKQKVNNQPSFGINVICKDPDLAINYEKLILKVKESFNHIPDTIELNSKFLDVSTERVELYDKTFSAQNLTKGVYSDYDTVRPYIAGNYAQRVIENVVSPNLIEVIKAKGNIRLTPRAEMELDNNNFHKYIKYVNNFMHSLYVVEDLPAKFVIDVKDPETITKIVKDKGIRGFFGGTKTEITTTKPQLVMTIEGERQKPFSVTCERGSSFNTDAIEEYIKKTTS